VGQFQLIEDLELAAGILDSLERHGWLELSNRAVWNINQKDIVSRGRKTIISPDGGGVAILERDLILPYNAKLLAASRSGGNLRKFCSSHERENQIRCIVNVTMAIIYTPRSREESGRRSEIREEIEKPIILTGMKIKYRPDPSYELRGNQSTRRNNKTEKMVEKRIFGRESDKEKGI